MASLHDKPDYGLRWFLHPVLNPVGHERCKEAVCASGTRPPHDRADRRNQPLVRSGAPQTALTFASQGRATQSALILCQVFLNRGKYRVSIQTMHHTGFLQ